MKALKRRGAVVTREIIDPIEDTFTVVGARHGECGEYGGFIRGWSTFGPQTQAWVREELTSFVRMCAEMRTQL